MKITEIAKQCEKVKINCDVCPCQKECSRVTEYLEDASPVMIVKMVQEDKDF